jgi:NADPH-dependent F420 reductase
VRVALVGGTGNFGPPLARRLKEAGYEVVIGSRDAEKARAVAAELGVEGAENAEAVRGADLVVLTTKADATIETARQLREAIGRTPVLCVGSKLRFSPQGVLPSDDPVSLAERLQEVLDAPVVAGLHSLAAATLDDGQTPDEDVLVCGDDPEAKALVLELAEKLTDGHAIDCGPLAGSRALEAMTALIVNVNKRYRAHAGIRLTDVG